MISLTALGRRIVAPTKEGDDIAAKKEALLRPRVTKDFLSRYNESRLPAEAIARNVLEESGVPAERTGDAFKLIVDGARSLGLLREVKGQTYVDLDTLPELVNPSPNGGTEAADAHSSYRGGITRHLASLQRWTFFPGTSGAVAFGRRARS